MNELFAFPAAHAGHSEWIGTQIGVSNVITRRRERLSAVDRELDAKPDARDRMLTNARRALEGHESFIHDLVFGGRLVRAFSNSHHLGDFVRENGWARSEWRSLTGQSLPTDLAVTAYAAVDAPLEQESAAVSKEARQVFVFNTSAYGDLRELLLEGLGAMPAAAVSVEGKGVLLVGGPDRAAIALGLLQQNGARLFSDDSVVLGNDTGRLVARAAEKRSYLRSDFVAAFPELAWELLGSRFENAPDVSPAFLDRNAAALETLATAVLAAAGPAAVNYFRTLAPDALRRLLARLIAFEGTRALVDLRAVYAPRRAPSNPAEPMPVDQIFVLKHDPSDATVLEPLPPERFASAAGLNPGFLAGRSFAALNVVFDRDAANRSWRDSILAAAQFVARTAARGTIARRTLSDYRS